jgi:hypothetical protein
LALAFSLLAPKYFSNRNEVYYNVARPACQRDSLGLPADLGNSLLVKEWPDQPAIFAKFGKMLLPIVGVADTI